MTKPRRPSVVSALAMITVMDVVARVGGFGRALAFATRLGRSRAENITDAAMVDATTRMVVMAAAFYPRRALCLEQSLALYVLLRRRGIAAELKVGIMPLPFSAHAWVEVDGAAVNEKQGRIEQLVTFQQLSA